MDDQIIDDNLHDNQVAEAVETLSLTDLPIAQDHGGLTFHDHQNPTSSSSAGEDYFEFFSGGLSDNSEDKMMCHAEDIIFCGKLVPIGEQLKHKKPSKKSEKNHRRNQPDGCRRSRSESMAEIKRTTVSPQVRNSRSLDYKKMKRNSSMSSEPEIFREGSGKKTSSSRWYVLLFGLVKVPPSEIDIRDIKNRRVRRTSSNTPLASSESFNALPDDQHKCSWRVLGFLSCKSSRTAAVTTPADYMPKV